MENVRENLGAVAMPRITTDHVPFVLEERGEIKRAELFKFYLSWYQIPNFESRMEKWWKMDQSTGFSNFKIWKIFKTVKQKYRNGVR